MFVELVYFRASVAGSGLVYAGSNDMDWADLGIIIGI